MSLECTKANIQSYDKYSVDRSSQHESSQLTVSCSALLCLSHSPCHMLNTFSPCHALFIFQHAAFHPYSFLGMPIHNPSFPLWSQHFIWCVLGSVAECFLFSTIFPNFYLQTIHSLFFFLFCFLPTVSIIDQIRPHVYFFPHLPVSSDVVLHSVFPH